MTDPTRHITSAPAESALAVRIDHQLDVVPAPALVLDLVQLPIDAVRGSYTVKGYGPGKMPFRSLFVHPSLAGQPGTAQRMRFLELLEDATFSDLFRTPESSLEAIASGRGALPPGTSTHGFGLAGDIDIDKTMRAIKAKTKLDLDLWMANKGLVCQRLDHRITSLKGESHHFHDIGGERATPRETSTAAAAQRRITALYGYAWATVDPAVAQAQLARLSLYRGDLDGKIGPISKSAIRIFRRGYGLGDSDRLDAKTFRTLVYVAAGRNVTPL